MDQNKKSKKIKGTNVLLEEIIKTIWRVNKIVKKREDLKGYWPHDDFGDKELKFKYFKIEPLREKPYFPSPGISQKAKKDQVNIIFPSTFWLKKRPYFPSPKSSKQEIHSNQ